MFVSNRDTPINDETRNRCHFSWILEAKVSFTKINATRERALVRILLQTPKLNSPCLRISEGRISISLAIQADNAA